MIEVDHLFKRYGSHYAVNDLSFTLEKGKIYGLLGPNGAGKSTTMNMLTGYLGATSGDIRIDGHSMTLEPEETKKYTGYLPDTPPLYVDMTVGEYLLTVAELKKIPHSQRKEQIRRVMDQLMLTDMKKRLIKNLSKGYRQRVGIAQVMLGSPEVIILDEPTVGLDPEQILEIRSIIRKLGEDHTVIVSSHILSEIAAVCDDVLIIYKGKLIARGSAEDLRHMASKETEIRLSAEGERKKIEAALEEVPNIHKVEIRETEEGLYEIRLQAESGRDTPRALFRAFSRADCPILEMGQAALNLEDIFLELTRKAQAASEKQGEIV